MLKDEIQKVDKKIEEFKKRKLLLLQKDKIQQRKLLTKQKILLGAWLLKNPLKHFSEEQFKKILVDMDSSIKPNRVADKKAIAELMTQFSGGNDE